MDQSYFYSIQLSVGAIILVAVGTMYMLIVVRRIDPVFRNIAARIIGVPIKLHRTRWTPDMGIHGGAKIHHEILVSLFHFAFLFTFVIIPWCLLFLAWVLFLYTTTFVEDGFKFKP